MHIKNIRDQLFIIVRNVFILYGRLAILNKYHEHRGDAVVYLIVYTLV